jgi:hypothetical protein
MATVPSPDTYVLYKKASRKIKFFRLIYIFWGLSSICIRIVDIDAGRHWRQIRKPKDFCHLESSLEDWRLFLEHEGSSQGTEMFRGIFYYKTSGSPSGSGFIIKYLKDEGLFKLKFNNDVSHLVFFLSYSNRLSMGSVHQK